MLEINKIYCGDCLELIKDIDDNSIDAVISDPPYGLEFMGKDWDKFKENNNWDNRSIEKKSKSLNRKNAPISQLPVFNIDLHQYQDFIYKISLQLYKVLKPGASLLMLGGTRTYHRLACGIEDAGFKIKDCLLWCYNSGFPKAQDLSAMIDKKLGKEREVVGKSKAGLGTGKTYAFTNNNKTNGMVDITKPSSPLAKQWQGWKVGGLKPSYEPIVWAVKPPDKTYIDNVLKHGVGAINVDECRIGYDSPVEEQEGYRKNWMKHKINKKEEDASSYYFETKKNSNLVGRYSTQGRYPSNQIWTDKLIGLENYSKFYFIPKASKKERNCNCGNADKYNGKFPCSKEDRNWNKHPTVKPIALMEHLIKLVTKENQLILEPFAGSGTTCIACKNLGRNFIGFEKEKDYITIANSRLENICKQKELFIVE